MTYDDVVLTVHECLDSDWIADKDILGYPQLIADEVLHSFNWDADVSRFLRTSRGTDARRWGVEAAQDICANGLRGLYRGHGRSVARMQVAYCIIAEIVGVEQNS